MNKNQNIFKIEQIYEQSGSVRVDCRENTNHKSHLSSKNLFWGHYCGHSRLNLCFQCQHCLRLTGNSFRCSTFVPTPCRRSGKAAKDGASAWLPAVHKAYLEKLLFPGFHLAQLRPLCPSRQWSSRGKISISPSFSLKSCLSKKQIKSLKNVH